MVIITIEAVGKYNLELFQALPQRTLRHAKSFIILVLIFASPVPASAVSENKSWGATTSSTTEPTVEIKIANNTVATSCDPMTTEQLIALGYVDSSSTLFDRTGVVIHEAGRALPGLNLYLSAHGAEAFLIDMSGTPIHRWSIRAEQLAGAATPPHHKGPWPLFWRKVHLLEDGGLLAIHEGYGVVRLDRNSNIRWISANGAHHDLWETDDGRVFVLARALIRDTVFRADGPFLEDIILEIDPNGNTIASWSILGGVRSSKHSQLLDRVPSPHGDPLHSNSIQVVDSRSALPGLGIHANDFIVSCRNINAILALNHRTGSITWLMAGATEKQHCARLGGDGQLTVFNNACAESGSSAVIIDLSDLSCRRSFPASSSPVLFSRCCGTTHLLANGNLLTTFTEASIALETDPSGNVVWEFRNAHQSVAPNRDSEDEKAMLYEVERIGFERWNKPFPLETAPTVSHP